MLPAPRESTAQWFLFRYESQVNSHLASEASKLLPEGLARSNDMCLGLSVSPCANKATWYSSKVLAPVVIVFQTILDHAGSYVSMEAKRP